MDRMNVGRRWFAPGIAVAFAAATGCAEDAADPDPGFSREETHFIYVHSRPPLDLLFVVDRSPSMADNARDLEENAAALGALLDQVGTALPDLHLAVVTSDLGAAAVPGCDAAGDRAAFQRAAACGIDGEFLFDLRDGNDTDRRRNFTGSRQDALACLLDLPLSTCPVNQPIAAMTAALDGRPGNTGFRRDGARLLVVVITDGDDCSLIDPAALDGPLTADVEAAIDFRCFARGTTCTPADPAAPGHHAACTPRDDGGLAGVLRTAELLGDDAGPAAFTIIAGGADADVTGPGVRLAPTCTGERVVGPAPRLAALAALPRSGAVDACQPDWSSSLDLLFRFHPIGDWTCFDGVVDTEPLVAGIQSECTGSLVQEDRATGDFVEVDRLHFCADPTRPPDAACAFWDESLAFECAPGSTPLRVDPNGEQRVVHARVRCAVGG